MTIAETENFLSDEIFKIDSMFSMYINISNSITEYISVMNISSAFFQASTLAFLENSTLRLCKLYEKDSAVISILKYLNKVLNDQKNSSKNKDVLAREVDECKKLIDAEEPKLVKLKQLRDNFLAHNDKKMILSDPFVSVGLTIGDYKSLMSLAGTIINRIRAVGERTKLIFKLVDDDDYKYILFALTEYTKEHPDFFVKVQQEKREKEKQLALDAFSSF